MVLQRQENGAFQEMGAAAHTYLAVRSSRDCILRSLMFDKEVLGRGSSRGGGPVDFPACVEPSFAQGSALGSYELNQ
jgi:hypothetical protein